MDMPGTIKQFFVRYPERRFAKGDIIIRAEQNPAGVFYIVQGSVAQYDIAANGNEVVVNVFKPGAFFPMSWAINDTRNSYYFEAVQDTVVHVAPAEAAVAFIRDNPDIMFNLLQRVFSGTDGVLRRMAHLMGGDAKTRLMFELINAAQRFGTANGGEIRIDLNESDLASRSGLARETVNRVLQQLKQSELIEVRNGALYINNLAELEAALGADL